MYDYGFFSYESKDDFLDRSREFWNPDKTDFWQDAGVDLVIDRREGYFFWDMAGRRLIDLHLNGGTYNLGHRNPELIATLEQAMQRFDIGNHHFPALARTALAEALVKTCPPNMRRVVYGAGGGEATDIAIKTARHTRQRRKIVSILKGYHGHTGLAVASRRRPLLDASSCPTGRTSSCRCRSTTSTRWRRRCARATWPRCCSRRSRPPTASRCPSPATCRA